MGSLAKKTKPIRISGKDEMEYKKLVRNTKNKIRNVKNKYHKDLSDVVDLPKLESFQTRDDYNEWKQKVKSFTNRNNLHYQFVKNEYDVVISKKDLNEITRLRNQEIRVAKAMHKKAENKPVIKGNKVVTTQGQLMKQMGRPSIGGVSIPKKFDFKKIRTERRLKEVKENAKKKSDPKHYDKRMERMKLNWMTMISGSLNSDADELVKRIEDIPPDDFLEIYNMFFLDMDFNDWDSEQLLMSHEKAMEKVNEIHSYIDRYERGELNMDMKGV